MNEINVNEFNGLRLSRRLEFHNWLGASLRGRVDFFERAFRTEFSDYYDVYTKCAIPLLMALLSLGRGWGVVIVAVWGVMKEFGNEVNDVTKRGRMRRSNKERKAAVKIREELEKFECLGIGKGLFSQRTIKRLLKRLKEKRFADYVSLLGLGTLVNTLEGISKILGAYVPVKEEADEDGLAESYSSKFTSLDTEFNNAGVRVNTVWRPEDREVYKVAVVVINEKIKSLV